MNSNGTKFATVIIARDTTEAPTDLEIKLRLCSQKLRVVPSLTGGANVLFPTSNTTVAVRVYDAVTIAKMEKEFLSSGRTVERSCRRLENRVQQSNMNSGANRDTDSGKAGKDNLCEVCSFRDSFKHSMIFFVLTNELITDQLGRVGSAVNNLQRRLSTYDDNENTASSKKKGNTRVFIVSAIESILYTISITLNSLTREKCELKEKFFLSQEQKFLPHVDTGQVQRQKAVTGHVANVFRSWSERAGISNSDANVIMNVLGSLDQIIAADERVLEDVPVSTNVKKKLLKFFGSVKCTSDVDGDNFDNDFKTVNSWQTIQPCSSGDANSFVNYRKREWKSIPSYQQTAGIPSRGQYLPNAYIQENRSMQIPYEYQRPLVSTNGDSKLQDRNSNQCRMIKKSFYLEGNETTQPSQLRGHVHTPAQSYVRGIMNESTELGNTCDNFYSY